MLDAFPIWKPLSGYLKFQSAFSRRIGERLDATVVFVVSAVQFD